MQNSTHLKSNIWHITGRIFAIWLLVVHYILKKVFWKYGAIFDEKYVLWEDGPFLTQYTRDNVLSTAYEIISIKYRLGGVSNGKPNPLIQKDIDLYNNVDRVAEIAKLKRITKGKSNIYVKREMVFFMVSKTLSIFDLSGCYD